MRMALVLMTIGIVFPKLKAGRAAWSAFAADLPLIGNTGPGNAVGLILLVLLGLGAFSLASGYLFRLSCLIYSLVYGAFGLNYFTSGYKTLPLYAATLCLVCLAMVITGPGKYSIAVKIEKK